MDTAEQGVQVAPAVRGQAAAGAGCLVQLALLRAGIQELLLQGAQLLQGLPAEPETGRGQARAAAPRRTPGFQQTRHPWM